MKNNLALIIARRATLIALDLLFSCALIALYLWGAASPAYAYVDPSVVTYAIQAVAGVAVALSAVIGVAWRKLRRFVFKVFKIDENAKKPVEPRVISFDEKGVASNVDVAANIGGAVNADAAISTAASPNEDAAANAGPASKAAALINAQAKAEKEAKEFFANVKEACNPRARKPLKWKKRLALSFLAAFSLFFTFLFVAPCEIMAAGSKELLLGVVDLWQLFAVATLIATIVLAFILSLIRGKAFDIIIGIIAAIALASCVQALFMNVGLPAANGRSVTWMNFAPIAIISGIVWAGLLLFAIITALRRSALLRRSIVCACIALIVVQAIEVSTLLGSSGTYNGQVVATEEDLFSVSPDKNTIVFCLDTMDNDLIERAKKINPNLFDEFTGFTLYEDSVGSLVPTRYALPYLLTGEMPQDNETYDEYINTRYSRSSLISSIREQDYSVGIYSTYTRDNGYLSDKADNIHEIDGLQTDVAGTLKALIKAACYRDLPWVVKPKFRFYTDDLNNELIVRSDNDLANEPYLMNDPEYYRQLTSIKLSADDTDKSGAFRFIHLKGAHSPSVMNENAQKVSGTTSRPKQIAGTFKIVEEYIKQLKELGVYDKTNIIITADHGDFEHDVDTLTKVTSPLLMVKPAQSEQADSEPLIVSQAKTGHMDYPATLISFVGGDYRAWGTPVWEATENSRKRYYITTDERSKYDQGFVEYEIDGPVWEISNWQKTGKTWKSKEAVPSN